MKKTTIKSFARTGKLANRIFAATLGLTVFASAFTFQSCKDGDDDPEDPKITSISPASALPGAQITITGQHFSKEAKNNTVNIGREGATVNSSTETTIITTVPATVTKVGPVDVYVTVEGRKSNVYNTFEIAEPEPDKPVLKTVDPTEAMPGDTIALTGEYLGAQSDATLTIGGETATIIEYSETAIKAQVPELEPGEAEIVLSLKGFGTVKLPVKFIVKAKPISVEGFMPDSAGYGDVVTISGKNFGTEKGDITVMVNGKKQEVTEVTDGQVKIKLEAKTWSGDVVVIKGEQKVTADKKLAYKEKYTLVKDPLLKGKFGCIAKSATNYFVGDDEKNGTYVLDLSFNIVDTIFKDVLCPDLIVRSNGEVWGSTIFELKLLIYTPSNKEEKEFKTQVSYTNFAENSKGVLYLGSGTAYKMGYLQEENDKDTIIEIFEKYDQPIDIAFDSNDNLLVKNVNKKITESIITDTKTASNWVNFESEFTFTGSATNKGGFILGHPAGDFVIYHGNDHICKIINKDSYININDDFSPRLTEILDGVLTESKDLIIVNRKNGMHKIIIE